MNNLKEHWNTVYSKSNTHKHTWTQDVPRTTLSMLDSLKLSKEVEIIDVGGGDSSLVDNLLGLGYKNITVLDNMRSKNHNMQMIDAFREAASLL